MKSDNYFNIGVLLILGLLAILMLFHGIPDSNRENVSMIIGALAGFLTRSVIHKNSDDPQDVNVVNPPEKPVPTEDKSGTE